MEASPPKHEIRGEPAGGEAGGLGALRLRKLEALVCRLQALTILLFCGCLGGLHAVAFFLFRGCSGGLGALRQLIEPQDRRLQAAAFFLTFGGCTVLNGTAPNRSVNPEHLLTGFFLFILGVVMAILTLAGGGAGRAAARMERFLRDFF